jgi:predicted ATPase
MRYIHAITITNFKIFDQPIEIVFEDTTVLIGPNNSGKTSAIQALTLWHQGIQTFFDAKTEIDKTTGKRKIKGKLDSSAGIGINRLDIAQVPVSDTRQLFNKAKIRTGTENQRIIITVKVEYDQKIWDCTMEFKYFKSEILYAYLAGDLIENLGLLTFAANLKINLLYPMSGLAIEETVLQEGAIRKQIGRGQTANLLRNVCYYLQTSQPNDWKILTDWVEKLFYIQLEDPRRLSTDDLILEYNYAHKDQKTDKSLNITQAGRGQQQVILILAFVLWKKNAIVLIDEPDAHLEVLRQSQIVEVLNDLARKYGNQIIIATHSEVIMNTMDKLTFLIDGKAIDTGSDTKPIKSALRDYGIEHYYKAQIHRRILYLEGTTDFQILKSLAQQLKHPLYNVLTDRPFVYYTQSPDLSETENALTEGYYHTHKKHFQALAPIVQNLAGIALFDSDNKNPQDELKTELKTLFWKQYEIENYFITPESVLAFAEIYFVKIAGPMFAPLKIKAFESIFEQHFLLPVFNNQSVLLNLYKNSSNAEQNELYLAQSSTKKISKLLENTIEAYAIQENEAVFLRKGSFFEIIPFCTHFDTEIKQKFDVLFDALKPS